MNSIVFIFVVVAAGIAYGQDREPVNICTGFETYQQIPDYTDCSRYYVCDATGTPLLQTCGSGFHFDAVQLRCNSPHLVTCFACPANQVFVDLPVDRNCRQFVRCLGDRARQQTCSDGLMFDPIRKQCNFERDVSCLCPLRDIPWQPVFFRGSDNCAKYRVCANGTEIHNECASGLHFNMDLHQCDFPNADCADTFLKK